MASRRPTVAQMHALRMERDQAVSAWEKERTRLTDALARLEAEQAAHEQTRDALAMEQAANADVRGRLGGVCGELERTRDELRQAVDLRDGHAAAFTVAQEGRENAEAALEEERRSHIETSAELGSLRAKVEVGEAERQQLTTMLTVVQGRLTDRDNEVDTYRRLVALATEPRP